MAVLKVPHALQAGSGMRSAARAVHLRRRAGARAGEIVSGKEITGDELEAIADEICGPRVRGRRNRHVEQQGDESKVRTGRPPRLRRTDEWELYCYRKAGMSIKQCASFFRVSVPTANRIIAKFRDYESRVEPTARAFRDMIKSRGDFTLS
jgi:hypothetical protein